MLFVLHRVFVFAVLRVVLLAVSFLHSVQRLSMTSSSSRADSESESPLERSNASRHLTRLFHWSANTRVKYEHNRWSINKSLRLVT